MNPFDLEGTLAKQGIYNPATEVLAVQRLVIEFGPRASARTHIGVYQMNANGGADRDKPARASHVLNGEISPDLGLTVGGEVLALSTLIEQATVDALKRASVADAVVSEAQAVVLKLSADRELAVLDMEAAKRRVEQVEATLVDAGLPVPPAEEPEAPEVSAGRGAA